MIIFHPPSGEGHRDLLRMLHALQHGTEALMYSNHPREAAASTSLAIIFLPVVYPGSSVRQRC